MKLSEILSDKNVIVEAQKVAQDLWPSTVNSIVDEELRHFKHKISITNSNKIPSTQKIPIENPYHWVRVDNVIACFVDMEGSTKLSARAHPSTTSKTYRLFTGTAVKLFHHFDASYIDIKGDGVFALFDSDKAYTALAATVSFKTFVVNNFTPTVEKAINIKIGGHFGIDQRTVLVRRLGLKAYGGRTDRQNEVWAGKPVNMASKLASLTSGGDLLVSSRFFSNIKDEKARMSCGCGNDGVSTPLWESFDLSKDDRFDFEKAYRLKSNWCKTHGKTFCTELVKLDE